MIEADTLHAPVQEAPRARRLLIRLLRGDRARRTPEIRCDRTFSYFVGGPKRFSYCGRPFISDRLKSVNLDGPTLMGKSIITAKLSSSQKGDCPSGPGIVVGGPFRPWFRRGTALPRAVLRPDLLLPRGIRIAPQPVTALRGGGNARRASRRTPQTTEGRLEHRDPSFAWIAAARTVCLGLIRGNLPAFPDHPAAKPSLIALPCLGLRPIWQECRRIFSGPLTDRLVGVECLRATSTREQMHVNDLGFIRRQTALESLSDRCPFQAPAISALVGPPDGTDRSIA